MSANHVLIRRAADGQWLRFQEPIEILQASKPEQALPLLDYIEREVESKKIYAAGFLSYEAGAAFDPAFKFHAADNGSFPLLWFGLFKKAVPAVLPPVPEKTDWPPAWQSSVTEEEYKRAISRIKEHIFRGATYQVNYTFRLRSAWRGGGENAFNLFCRLTAGKNIPYAAFIETERFAVCSLSPELFFELNGAEIFSRPMKGTMPRGLMPQDDALLAKRLYLSEKNRAENVMIVDMARNDLGKIAAADSVRVASLFDIEKHDTVWQMTSTVKARTLSGLAGICRANFPPASVTGAPKVKTMGIIADLETSPRRIYTGCIGFLAPGRRAQFNVAIRTLLIDKQLAQAEYGVGGGIVWDSSDEAEYGECVLKAKILREQHGEFSLLETLLWTPEENYFLLDLHIARLKASADYFSFKCDETAARNELAALAKTFSGRPQRARLLLARDGRISREAKLCEPDQEARPFRVRLAKRNIASDNPFLYHKTTNRIVYDEARRECESYDEVVLWNEKGEVTEFCAGNIIVNLDGKMVTPPVRCGLLPGTYRAWLLAKGRVAEEIIKKEDLLKAKEIYFCNSVRKMREARIETGN